MDELNVNAVILCGGVGKRLWPLSNMDCPKQFVNLHNNNSFFQDTLSRLVNFNNKYKSINETIIIASEYNQYLLENQINQIGYSNTTNIYEPCSKNTAVSLTLGAMVSHKLNDDPILLVLPSDHYIENINVFNEQIYKGIKLAQQSKIVVFGVNTTFPSSDYGYIEVNLESSQKDNYFYIQKFFEKPELELANQFYSNQSRYFWNSGILIVRSSIWLKLLQNYEKDMFNQIKNVWKCGTIINNCFHFDKKKFSNITSKSIDYAVLEKHSHEHKNLIMLKLGSKWDDMGTWQKLSNLFDQSAGNSIYGNVDNHNSSNNIVYSSDKLVSLVEVNDLLVVNSQNALLITNKSQKDLDTYVNLVNEKDLYENQGKKTFRPWGWFENIDEGDNFKVKKINVLPQASLSLQYHNHRAEHWVVVEGEAEVTIEQKIFTLKLNESTFIPKGKIHRLKNLTSKNLQIIEVQTGDYLEEDDIIRLEDNYGR